jgi:hypothetical protein
VYVQCVHKVHSRFWKIVARKQIELATCGLRQITAKLWKFFLTPTDGISGHLYVSQSLVCEMATVQERALCVGWFFERKSVTQTQRNDRTQFNKQPPSDYAFPRNWQRPWSQEKWQTGCERWMCGNNPCIVCTKPYKIHTSSFAWIVTPTFNDTQIATYYTIFQNPE